MSHLQDGALIIDGILAESARAEKTNCAFILPSTDHFFAIAEALVELGFLAVGGQLKATKDQLNPNSVLSRLSQLDMPPVCRVICFSDQLVAPEVAQIPVMNRGEKEFHSVLEVILAKKYQFRLVAWCGARFAICDPSESLTYDEVFSCLAAYLRVCDKYGDHWKARGLQSSRTLDERMRLAERQNRLYRSIVLLAAARGSIACQQARSYLGKLDAAATGSAFWSTQ